MSAVNIGGSLTIIDQWKNIAPQAEFHRANKTFRTKVIRGNDLKLKFCKTPKFRIEAGSLRFEAVTQ